MLQRIHREIKWQLQSRCMELWRITAADREEYFVLLTNLCAVMKAS